MTEPKGLIASGTDPDVAAAMVVYQRLDAVKDALGIGRLSDAEVQVFAMVAHHTGLDPFTKQIYAIKRGGKVIHQTGIDGYRSTAERTKEYRGSDEAEYEMCDCDDAGSPKPHPALARVRVYRAYPEGIRSQVGIARWHELKPKHIKRDGAYDFEDHMWWQQPFGQLAKCAEAAGMRKAFPRVFGGVYIAEEVERDDTIEGNAVEVAPTAKGRMAERRAKAQAAEAPSAPTTAAYQEAAAEDANEAEQVDGEVVEDAPRTLTLGDFMRIKGEKGVQFGGQFNATVERLFPGTPWAKLDDAQRYLVAAELGMVER